MPVGVEAAAGLAEPGGGPFFSAPPLGTLLSPTGAEGMVGPRPGRDRSHRRAWAVRDDLPGTAAATPHAPGVV